MTRALLAGIAGLLLLSPVVAPASAQTDALSFYKNYFVTGDYAVAGVGLRGLGVNGLATGTIQISDVPADADVVAAFLYWQVVTTNKLGPDSGSLPVTFRGYPLKSADGPFGKVLGAGTPPCWSSGGSTGSSGGAKLTFTYRADVLRFFDIADNGKFSVNGAHQVQVPDSGSSGSGVPLAMGASLVVIYRTSGLPLSAIVLYDGGYTLDNATRTMSQTIRGFYQPGSATAKMTHIVGSGQLNKSEQLLFNGDPLATNPFRAAAGESWDNPTFDALDLGEEPESVRWVTTAVGPSEDCLTWGAVVFKTEVKDFDGDGLLDVWEDQTSELPPLLDPNGQPLPNLGDMGADKNVKDLFIEVGYMHADNDAEGNPPTYGGVEKPAHSHLPSPAALKLVGDAFCSAPPNTSLPADPALCSIRVHFDVGDYPAGTEAEPYIIRGDGLLRGGDAIDERVTVCDRGASPPWVCQFSDYPGTVGWKTGFKFLRDQVLGSPAPLPGQPDTCDAPGNDGPGQACERRFDRNRKDMFRYALFAHAIGLPVSEAPCLDAAGRPSQTDSTTGRCAVRSNPDFHIPRTNTGVGDFPGGDVMVTLGAFPDTTGAPIGDAEVVTPFPVGTAFMQASTLMHELGHTFERRHGGEASNLNCQPTYLSVMNYLYQLRGLLDDRGRPNLDFSRDLNPELDETALREGSLAPLRYRIGWYAPLIGSFLEDKATAARRRCDGTNLRPGEQMVRFDARTTDTPIDWNANGTLESSDDDLEVDVNFNGRTSLPAPVGPDVLRGPDDWSAIVMNQTGGRRNTGALFVLDATGRLAVGALSADTGRGDLGRGDLGRGDLGRGDLGRGDLGRGDLGRGDLGRGDLGRGDLGTLALGRGDLGRGDLGGGDLFAGDPNNPGGELDFETAGDLAKTPPNEFTACVIGVDCPGDPAGAINLAWVEPNVGGVAFYTAYRVAGAELLPGGDWVAVDGAVQPVPGAPGKYFVIDEARLTPGAPYTYFAVATYADGIQSDASNLVTITGPKAASTVTVTCPTDVHPFTGLPQTPCTAAYSTADGLMSGTLTVSYADNTNAGVASASATYAGDDAYEGSTGTGSFTIGKATSTTVVSCPASVPYTGMPQTPCTATYSTADGLSGSLGVSYTNNKNAGVAAATATYPGDDNHEGSTRTASFTIGQATPAFSNLAGPTIAAGATPTFLGGTITAGTFIPTGSVSITLNGVTQAAPIDPGTGAFSASFATGGLSPAGSPYTITYSYAGGGNFAAAGPDTTKSLTVEVKYGFVSVQNLPPPSGKAFNVGSSVPLRWQFTVSGTVVDSVNARPQVSILTAGGLLTFSPADPGSSSFQPPTASNGYTWQFNWQTKDLAAGTYKVYIGSLETGQVYGAAAPNTPFGPFAVKLK